jgi:hypothetical protein
LLSLSWVGFLHISWAVYGREQFSESQPGSRTSFTVTGGFAATSSLKRVIGRIFKVIKCYKKQVNTYVAFDFLAKKDKKTIFNHQCIIMHIQEALI